jgi:hypothetical protein
MERRRGLGFRAARGLRILSQLSRGWRRGRRGRQGAVAPVLASSRTGWTVSELPSGGDGISFTVQGHPGR